MAAADACLVFAVAVLAPRETRASINSGASEQAIGHRSRCRDRPDGVESQLQGVVAPGRRTTLTIRGLIARVRRVAVTESRIMGYTAPRRSKCYADPRRDRYAWQ